MTAVRASDEVTDAIALIEVQRQYMEKESGLATACTEALRKLHELLAQETAASQAGGPGGGHLVDVEAVMMEIKRVKNIAGIASQSAMSKHARGRQQKKSMPRSNNPHHPARDKGRRTMGRRGDR